MKQRRYKIVLRVVSDTSPFVKHVVQMKRELQNQLCTPRALTTMGSTCSTTASSSPAPAPRSPALPLRLHGRAPVKTENSLCSLPNVRRTREPRRASRRWQAGTAEERRQSTQSAWSCGSVWTDHTDSCAEPLPVPERERDGAARSGAAGGAGSHRPVHPKHPSARQQGPEAKCLCC
jgi:hypothetical protein